MKSQPVFLCGASFCRSKNMAYAVFSLRDSDQGHLIDEMRRLAADREHRVFLGMPGDGTNETGFAFPLGDIFHVGPASPELAEQINGWSYCREVDGMPEGIDVPLGWTRSVAEYIPFMIKDRVYTVFNGRTKEQCTVSIEADGSYSTTLPAALEWRYWTILECDTLPKKSLMSRIFGRKPGKAA